MTGTLRAWLVRSGRGGDGTEQALLVAWGGVNKVARQELRNQFFRVRVWDAEDLLNAVLRNYERLSEEIRADLSLKRIWSLVEE